MSQRHRRSAADSNKLAASMTRKAQVAHRYGVPAAPRHGSTGTNNVRKRQMTDRTRRTVKSMCITRATFSVFAPVPQTCVSAPALPTVAQFARERGIIVNYILEKIEGSRILVPGA